MDQSMHSEFQSPTLIYVHPFWNTHKCEDKASVNERNLKRLKKNKKLLI